MGKVSKTGAQEHAEAPGFEGHYGEVDGYMIGFEAFSLDQDPAPLFKGLPNDRCQSAHWGVVLKGKLVFRYGDGTQETVEAGEAYYARPDHLPLLFAGSEIVEFSPAADFAKTVEVVMSNAAALSTPS
jgi:hypothetical protein